MLWGPEIAGDLVRFRLWAPDRRELTLEMDGRDGFPMQCEEDGWFSAQIPARAGDRYRFRLDAELAVPDPASREQAGGVHGWSVLVDPAEYPWRSNGWSGRPWEEAVIQEVHTGVLGGFSGVTERLPALAELGVTAVELMPVAAFAGTRGWGYDGVLPYAVHESYGRPAELKALVDRAHELGLMMILDVVYNHFGPEGNYLGAYAAPFFDHHADTPWGSAVAVSREPVRRFFIENALMWLGEYRFDALRFDAVHAIADDRFLDNMAQEIRSSLAGRHIHLVLENERNDADRLSPGLFDAQWNDDFHNVLHVLLTGESEGYYSGFSDAPEEKLSRCLAQGFIYQGETPPGEDAAPRGKPSSHLPASSFVAFLQNHDQIGNRALGERLTVLADHGKLRAAVALLLLSPQIPLIFMGDEAGSRSPFLFFTDFHNELAEAVREGRRKEFAHFSAFADSGALAAIPDPNARRTFETSIPQPGHDADHWHALYAELLALRHEHIIPRLKGAKGIDAQVLGPGAVAARWKMADETSLSIALNLGEAPAGFPPLDGEPLFEIGAAGQPGSFRAVLSR